MYNFLAKFRENLGTNLKIFRNWGMEGWNRLCTSNPKELISNKERNEDKIGMFASRSVTESNSAHTVLFWAAQA